MRWRSLLLWITLISCVTGDARAHDIIPDGLATEWLTREPAAIDSAIVVRDREEPGELVWRDRAGDARSDDDVTQMRVHGNPMGFGVLLRFAAAPSACAQVQIAVDLDRAPRVGAPTFSNDPATRLREDARAEWILVATAAGGVLRDATGAARGSFAAAVGADGLELFVPWASLGLARWPVAMRLTTALFCAPDRVHPVAPSDGLPSAAIDVLTDYGGPASMPRATRDELSDGVIDHALTTRHGISGTIVVPLSVQRLAPLASREPGRAWIELVNRSDERLSLDGFAVGNEPMPGGAGALFELPRGRSLDRGATLIVALSGAAYRRFYGLEADVELFDTDPATPDATPLRARATGSLAFDPRGDEVAVFDEERTLVDVVPFNDGAYPGVRAFAPLTDELAITRNASGLDTDDCAVDFFGAGAVCGRTADCPDPQCNECDQRVCGERPDGLTCSIDRCPIGRCVAGACRARPDAALCVVDASADASADASMDGARDVMAFDVDATMAYASDVTIEDVSVTHDVHSERTLDASEHEDRSMDTSERDDLSAPAQDATTAIEDGGTRSEPPSPRAGCACRVASKPAQRESDGRGRTTTAMLVAWTAALEAARRRARN